MALASVAGSGCNAKPYRSWTKPPSATEYYVAMDAARLQSIAESTLSGKGAWCASSKNGESPRFKIRHPLYCPSAPKPAPGAIPFAAEGNSTSYSLLGLGLRSAPFEADGTIRIRPAGEQLSAVSVSLSPLSLHVGDSTKINLGPCLNWHTVKNRRDRLPTGIEEELIVRAIAREAGAVVRPVEGPAGGNS